MREGMVALTALPQADGRIKQRPVVLLGKMPGYGDWLVCGISSQLWQEVAGFDEHIVSGDEDYAASGLKAPSLIRLGFLATLPEQAISGVIGEVAVARHRRLLVALASFLQPR